MVTRFVLAVAGLCCLGAAPRPNVVLIVADDLGRGDLGCYGATKIATPNIDRLAREGVRFTDAHSTCAVCQPSRYAILSGTYYFRCKRKPNQLYFHDGQLTLPAVLQPAGYRTAAFGKWHLGFGRSDTLDYNGELKPGPLEVGFDDFFGTPVTHNEPPFVYVEDHHVVGLDPSDPIQIVPAKETKEGWGHGISTGGRKAHEARPVETIDLVLADKAAAWIAGQPAVPPFFAYVAFLAPHVPIAPAKEFQGTSRAGAYGDYVQQLDKCVGRVLEALERQGLSDDTLVIFTSDNGGLAHADALAAGHRTNGDLLGQKTDVWEGGHAIPLVARLPGRIPAGQTCDRLVGLVDLMATIAAFCDVPLPPDAAPDSIDQSSLFERPQSPAVREELVLHGVGGFGLRSHNYVYLPRPGSMGLTVPISRTTADARPFGQPWKSLGFEADGVSADGVITSDAPADQLYDLAADPRQRKNIVLEQPDRAKALRTRLEALGPVQPKLPAAALPEGPAEALKPAAVRRPTVADVRYGNHPRQLLHLWQAEAKNGASTPVVVFIHGGGWVGGDRMSGIDTLLEPLLAAGISVASVEYRLLVDAMREGVSPPVMAPMHDAARAVQFIRSKAAEWRIDPEKLAVAGGSAGGCTSLWLAFHDDLADPRAADPVARLSTRPACAAVINAQTSLDAVQMKEWIPNSYYGGHAFGILKQATVDPPVAEAGKFGMDFRAFLARRNELLPLIEKFSPHALVSPGDPPVYLFYRHAPAPGQAVDDPTHSANFGVKLAERCRELGVPCEVVHPETVNPVHADVTTFLIRFLRL